MGEVRVPARRQVAGADPAGGGELPDLRAAARAGAPARASRRSRRAAAKVNAQLGVLDDDMAAGHRGGRPRGRARRVGRRVPDRRLPDRLGHVEQHERQRGDRHPGQRGRSAAPCTPTTTSTPRSRATTSSRPASTSRRRRASSTTWSPRSSTCETSLQRKAAEFADVVKSGRTHLMDAGPVTLGQEFGGYAAQVGYGIERLQAALPRVAELPLGGTAVGTGINTPPGFAAAVIAELAARHRAAADRGPQPLRGPGRRDGLVELSGQLRTIAVGLNKICNDIRWMGSGPRAGLGEIRLPDLQPGSSIMPGKVNPVIPEATTMVCAQVIGNDAAVAFAGRGRQLRAQRDAAGDRPQRPGVDPAAGQRRPAARRPLHRRHRGRRRALPRARRVLARRSSRR